MRKLILLVLFFTTFFSFAQTETINSKLIVNGNTSVNTDDTTTANLFIKSDGVAGSILTVETSTGIQGFKIGANGVPWSGGIIQDVNDTNTVFGLNAGSNEVFTTGYLGFGKFNTYYGYNSGWLNQTGIQNNYFGSNSGFRNVTGSRNTMFGNATVGPSDGAGNDNLGFGEQTGQPIVSGNQNMLIGNRILGFSNPLDNVSQAIAIGHFINLLGDTGTGGNTSINEIVIGTNSVGNGSNTVTIGNTSTTDNYFEGNVYADSYIANGKTSDDVLLGDGTTTTLSGLDGKFVDGTDPLDAVYNVSDGNVGVGLDAPTTKLHIKGDGIDDVFTAETSTGKTGLKVLENGYVGIGTDTPSRPFNIITEGAASVIYNQSFFNSTFGAFSLYASARGTQLTPLALQQDDELGRIEFRGYNGTGYSERLASIVALQENTPNGTAAGSAGRLELRTSASDSPNEITKINILSTGEVAIGNHTPTARLHVKTDLLTDDIIKAEAASGNINFLVTEDGTIPYKLVTQAERLAISAPTTGLHVYQTDNAESVYVNKSTGWEKFVTLKAYTVATLPAGVTGDIAYVTDGSAITYRATATGGGAGTALVFFDGTNWIYH